MANAVGADVDQGHILAAVRQTAPDIHATQGFAITAYNVPARNVTADQAHSMLSIRALAHVQVTQTHSLVVCRGRVASPQVRAFTFTLDGHDFYALRLGDQGTILYDASTQQWVDWRSTDLDFWRVNAAINWVGAQKLGAQYGTDILVGDDTWGLLYFLDPEQAYDDPPDYLSPIQQFSFERIAMAQTTVPGRQYVPCYAIFLDGDNYGLTAVDFVPSVELETSDDQGQTFISHGVITVQPNTENQNYRWYSLGQMESPGRLFRITDNGILARIDSMEMNDDG